MEAEIGKYYETPDYISHTDTRKGAMNNIYHYVRSYMLGRKARLSKTPGAMTFPPLKCAFGICSWKYSTKWQACSVNRSSRVKNTEGS